MNRRLFRSRQPYPTRGPHAYRWLVDGGAFFPAMLQAIGRARHRVLLEMYLAESGPLFSRFAEALSDAARRGVQVHLLLDGFGGLGVSDADRERLLEAGVHLGTFNPLGWERLRLSLFRDHRKLLAVDGHVAFVGGAGLTDAFDPRVTGTDAWHDVMLEIRGPCVQDWEALFADAWQRWHHQDMPGLGDLSCEGAQPSDPRDGRVVGHTDVGGQAVMRSVIATMKRSRRRIWLTTGYFVPTRRLRRILTKAARRGMDVRLLLPGPKTDHPGVWHAGRRFYGRLLRSGVRIFEFQPRCLHAKYVICDDWLTVGSSNLDHWTLRWNMEANQEVTNPTLVDQVVDSFSRDLLQSQEWTLERWQARGLWARLMERLFGALDGWLVELGYLRDLRDADRALLRNRRPSPPAP